MAKSRHSRKSAATRRYKATHRPLAAPSGAAMTVAAPPRDVEAAKVAAPPSKGSAASRVVDLVSEYRYVLSDLKRLGILAAAMFVTLVVLALVVR